jgi:hypothetical protein
MPNSRKVPALKAIEQQRIPIVEGRFHDKEPVFSFKYYDHAHVDFSICTHTMEDVKKLFSRLRDYSRMLWREVIQHHGSHHHEVHWRDTAYPNGFENIPVKIREGITPRQFALEGIYRIFGFFDGTTFYIVWFDKDHKVYPID